MAGLRSGEAAIRCKEVKSFEFPSPCWRHIPIAACLMGLRDDSLMELALHDCGIAQGLSTNCWRIDNSLAMRITRHLSGIENTTN